jgi:hypothetical protein
MAELGLAGIARFFVRVYQSAKDAHKDVKEASRHIELLESVLNELHQTVDGVYSDSAEQTIRGLLTQCNSIFVEIRKHTDLYEQCQKPKWSLGHFSTRLKWHFWKDEVKLLIAQLYSIKSTLHLIVALQSLGKQLSHESATRC